MDTAHFAPVYGSALHKHLNRRGKSAKAVWMARMLDKEAEQAWIGEAERPYQLKDLAGPYKAFARVYYNNLTRDQLKAECLDYGLPVSGPKYKIVDRLQRHANSKQFGQETQLAAKNDAGSPSPPALQPKDALKVRRALVADLRRGLVWDKKFKRGGAKILKAQYAGCSKQLFTELFPHSAGKEKVALDLERDLQVGHLGRMLRYGGSLELQPGSLSAKFDAAVNTVTVSGKYTMM